MSMKPHIQPLLESNSNEWYTPAHIIDRVIAVMGKIDLDPCSNSHTAPNVPAGQHYTADDDGLTRPWYGRVYMNPPYGRQVARWIDKLLEEHHAARVPEAIVLVAARTDTHWHRKLRDFDRCYVTGRIKFITSGDPYRSGAPFPSMIAYIGPSPRKFYGIMAPIGDIYRNVERIL